MAGSKPEARVQNTALMTAVLGAGLDEARRDPDL